MKKQNLYGSPNRINNWSIMTRLMSSFCSTFFNSSTNSSSRFLQTFNNHFFFDKTSCSSAFSISIWSFFLLLSLSFFCSPRYVLYLCLDTFINLISCDDGSILPSLRSFFSIWSMMCILAITKSWLILTLLTDLDDIKFMLNTCLVMTQY